MWRIFRYSLLHFFSVFMLFSTFFSLNQTEDSGCLGIWCSLVSFFFGGIYALPKYKQSESNHDDTYSVCFFHMLMNRSI